MTLYVADPITVINPCWLYVNMCHYGTERWEEEVRRLTEEEPEEEFKTETEPEETETEARDEKPVPADD